MRKGIFAACIMLACSTAWAAFDDWDSNGNDELSESEFLSGVDDAGLYGRIDEDDDGFVDESEFEDAGIEGEWDEWDANDDGYVDSKEFYEGTFSAFDEDDDDTWDDDEWDTASSEDWLRI